MKTRMNQKWLAAAGVALLTQACGSGPKKLDVEQRTDIKIIQASQNPPPAWIDNFGEFQDSKEKSGRVYFVGESGAVNDRLMGCDSAKMRANEKISQEVATFIDGKMAEFSSGQLRVDENNPVNPGLANDFSKLLKSKTMSMLHGVRDDGTFWLQKKNTTNDGTFYECSKLVSLERKALDQLIQKASREATKLIQNPEAHKQTIDALKSLDGDNFKSN